MSGYELFRGDSLEVLRGLAAGSVDAIIADPPYSSGGMHGGERARDPAEKYVQHGTRLARPSFLGDNRDQRSWAHWMALWLGEGLRLVKEGGYCLIFSDWRQAPSATDALQAGGWVWRGTVVWDKTEGARAPHRGYFRHQCEYIIWGSRGALRLPEKGGPWPGCYRQAVLQRDKHHMTGKPTALMRRLVQCAPAGGVILDPFMGSGTTGVAALLEGRHFIGVEMDETYFEVARRRIEAARLEVENQKEGVG